MAMNMAGSSGGGRRGRGRAVRGGVNLKGQVFLNDTEIALNDLVPKLKAITEARGGLDERIFVRGDKNVDYGTGMKVMGRLSAAGFRRVALVTEVDQG